MKVYLEPETQKEFYTLPNPWLHDNRQTFGLTEANCSAFGWTTKDVPEPEPIEEPKKYSTLSIIRMLGDDWENVYKPQLVQAKLLDQFMAANYLKEDDPAFKAFLTTVPEDVKAKLEYCLWEPY